MQENAAKETVIIIRPSFKKICNNDACRAALFNHLLYCIACKVINGSDYWYGTLEEIHQGIDESWSMGKMRKELDELLKQGIIGQRHNEVKKWDRTLQYFFNKEHAKKLKELCKKLGIDLSYIGLPSQVMHLLNLTNAFDKCVKSNVQIKQMEVSNMADPFVNNDRAIPKVTTKVTSKVTTKSKNDSPKPPVSEETDTQTIILTTEELQMSDWIEDIEGKIKLTVDRKKEYAEIAPYAKSLEDMMSLRDFAKARIPNHNENTRVYPKNMANCVKAWAKNKPKQEEKPASTTQEDDSRLVLWTRKMFKGSNVEHWYYFEHMTLAEAKQQENKFVMPLSVNDRRQIESKLEKLAKGEISLPEGVLVA